MLTKSEIKKILHPKFLLESIQLGSYPFLLFLSAQCPSSCYCSTLAWDETVLNLGRFQVKFSITQTSTNIRIDDIPLYPQMTSGIGSVAASHMHWEGIKSRMAKRKEIRRENTEAVLYCMNCVDHVHHQSRRRNQRFLIILDVVSLRHCTKMSLLKSSFIIYIT